MAGTPLPCASGARHGVLRRHYGPEKQWNKHIVLNSKNNLDVGHRIYNRLQNKHKNVLKDARKESIKWYNCKGSVKDLDILCTETVDKVDHISQQTLGEKEEEDCTSDNTKINSTKGHVRPPHTSPRSLRHKAYYQNWMKVKVILDKLWQYNANKEKENAVNLSINTMGKANDSIGGIRLEPTEHEQSTEERKSVEPGRHSDAPCEVVPLGISVAKKQAELSDSSQMCTAWETFCENQTSSLPCRVPDAPPSTRAISNQTIVASLTQASTLSPWAELAPLPEVSPPSPQAVALFPEAAMAPLPPTSSLSLSLPIELRELWVAFYNQIADPSQPLYIGGMHLKGKYLSISAVGVIPNIAALVELTRGKAYMCLAIRYLSFIVGCLSRMTQSCTSISNMGTADEVPVPSFYKVLERLLGHDGLCPLNWRKLICALQAKVQDGMLDGTLASSVKRHSIVSQNVSIFIHRFNQFVSLGSDFMASQLLLEVVTGQPESDSSMQLFPDSSYMLQSSGAFFIFPQPSVDGKATSLPRQQHQPCAVESKLAIDVSPVTKSSAASVSGATPTSQSTHGISCGVIVPDKLCTITLYTSQPICKASSRSKFSKPVRQLSISSKAISLVKARRTRMLTGRDTYASAADVHTYKIDCLLTLSNSVLLSSLLQELLLAGPRSNRDMPCPESSVVGAMKAQSVAELSTLHVGDIGTVYVLAEVVVLAGLRYNAKYHHSCLQPSVMRICVQLKEGSENSVKKCAWMSSIPKQLFSVLVQALILYTQGHFHALVCDHGSTSNAAMAVRRTTSPACWGQHAHTLLSQLGTCLTVIVSGDIHACHFLAVELKILYEEVLDSNSGDAMLSSFRRSVLLLLKPHNCAPQTTSTPIRIPDAFSMVQDSILVRSDLGRNTTLKHLAVKEWDNFVPVTIMEPGLILSQPQPNMVQPTPSCATPPTPLPSGHQSYFQLSREVLEPVSRRKDNFLKRDCGQVLKTEVSPEPLSEVGHAISQLPPYSESLGNVVKPSYAATTSSTPLLSCNQLINVCKHGHVEDDLKQLPGGNDGLISPLDPKIFYLDDKKMDDGKHYQVTDPSMSQAKVRNNSKSDLGSNGGGEGPEHISHPVLPNCGNPVSRLDDSTEEADQEEPASLSSDLSLSPRESSLHDGRTGTDGRDDPTVANQERVVFEGSTECVDKNNSVAGFNHLHSCDVSLVSCNTSAYENVQLFGPCSDTSTSSSPAVTCQSEVLHGDSNPLSSLAANTTVNALQHNHTSGGVAGRNGIEDVTEPSAVPIAGTVLFEDDSEQDEPILASSEVSQNSCSESVPCFSESPSNQHQVAGLPAMAYSSLFDSNNEDAPPTSLDNMNGAACAITNDMTVQIGEDLIAQVGNVEPELHNLLVLDADHNDDNVQDLEDEMAVGSSDEECAMNVSIRLFFGQLGQGSDDGGKLEDSILEEN